MKTKKPQMIVPPIVSEGAEPDPAEPTQIVELDMEGFVPPSDELDLTDLIPIYVEEPREPDHANIDTKMKLRHDRPVKRKPWSIFDELKPSAIEATRKAGEALDTLSAIEGPGWRRPPIPEHRLPGIIDRLRRREWEIVESNYVELLLKRAQELWKSNAPKDWEEAKFKRMKALAAPFEAARVSYEAARLEAALRLSRPVPGGLLDIDLAGRTAWGIPDVHGNEWGLWMIWNTPLEDGPPLKERINDGDIVIDMGDVSHPDFDPLDHWPPSANILRDMIALMLEHPHHFKFEPGNHEAFYGGGEDIFLKGDISQGILFRDYLLERYGLAFARTLQAIVDSSPFFARTWARDEVISAVAHSPVTHGGMTPEEAIVAPYDIIHRHELTWNRPFEYEGKKPYEPKDLMDSRRKIASPYTIFAGGHSGHPKKASWYQPDDMPGHVIGQATAHYNDELAILKITPDFVGVVNVVGDTELAGRNLRQEFIDSLRPRKGLLKLLRFRHDEDLPQEDATVSPFRKSGGNGPCAYRQDPVEFSRHLSDRDAYRDTLPQVEERTETMISKGLWFGTVSDTPLTISADGEIFRIVGIFGSSIEGDAGEIMGATDELIVEKVEQNGDTPLRGLLRDGPNFIGTLAIFKSGRHLSIETGAQKGSSIASGATLYLKRTGDGQARLTVHDPSGFTMSSTEIPEPTRVSKSTAMPPPPPNGKQEGTRNNPSYAGVIGPVSTVGKGQGFAEPSHPMEISALACRGAIESSMPGIAATTMSAMLAFPQFRV